MVSGAKCIVAHEGPRCWTSTVQYEMLARSFTSSVTLDMTFIDSLDPTFLACEIGILPEHNSWYCIEDSMISYMVQCFKQHLLHGKASLCKY